MNDSIERIKADSFKCVPEYWKCSYIENGGKINGREVRGKMVDKQCLPVLTF